MMVQEGRIGPEIKTLRHKRKRKCQTSTLTHFPVLGASIEPDISTNPNKRGIIPELRARDLPGTRETS